MGMWISRAKQFLLGDKGRKLIIGGAVAAMILLLLSTVSCGGSSGSSTNRHESAEQIEEKLENRLAELISCIDGVSDVKVMITLDVSSQTVYEKDESSSHSLSENGASGSSTQTEVVLAGSGKEPVEVGTIQPEVRGVAIVCGGASDPVIREKVANIAAKALNIGMSRVYVTD